MKWNHRVVDLSAENGGEPLFGLREVYYGDDGKPESYCDPFMVGDDLAELRRLVERLEKALAEPVVKFELRYCRACETEVDAVDGECTKCGQPTEEIKDATT